MENTSLKDENSSGKVSPSGARGISWGTYIVIAFVLFISFILYFVIKVQTDNKYDNDLVVEEYYKHDVHFQEEMSRIQNAHDLKTKPTITVSFDGVKILFPADFNAKDIKGTVAFYRPSNKKFDFQKQISFTDSASLFVPKNKFIAGEWYVNMEWQYKDKSYLTKEKIYIK